MASCTMWPQMFWRLEAHKVGRFHYLVVDLPQLGLLLLLLRLLLKDDLVSWDYDIPNMMEKYKIHVPNHQSDYVKCPFLEPVLSTSSLSRVVFQVSHNSSQENTRWTLPTLPTICENRGPFNRRIQNWNHRAWDGRIDNSSSPILWWTLHFLICPFWTHHLHRCCFMPLGGWISIEADAYHGTMRNGNCFARFVDQGNLWDPCKLHQASASMGIDGQLRWLLAGFVSQLNSPVKVLNTANCGISSTTVVITTI